MTVGNNDRGVRDTILRAGIDDVGVRGIMANGWNGCICGYYDCLLGAGGLATGIVRATGRTLKISRMSSRPNLQAAIVSLFFFAWKCRETAFRLPHLTNFL